MEMDDGVGSQNLQPRDVQEAGLVEGLPYLGLKESVEPTIDPSGFYKCY